MRASTRTVQLTAAAIAVLSAVAGGCGETDQTHRACGPGRAELAAALARAGITDRHRALTHLSHVCDLVGDRGSFHVVDVREVVPYMEAPRGFNQIVILDRELDVRRSFHYVAERPLRCFGSRLLLHGDATFPGDDGPLAGNLLVFSRGVDAVEAERLDWNHPPPYAVAPE